MGPGKVRSNIGITASFVELVLLFFLIAWSLSLGISGFDWVLIAIGIVLDISSHTGAGYRHRDRFRRD
ncbi:MAG: hypothetical protein ACXWE7_11445 [Nitrososphaeraceae archaeon]